jgi:hypothetical protein
MNDALSGSSGPLPPRSSCPMTGCCAFVEDLLGDAAPESTAVRHHQRPRPHYLGDFDACRIHQLHLRTPADLGATGHEYEHLLETPGTAQRPTTNDGHATREQHW